jgi:hypothetical protein
MTQLTGYVFPPREFRNLLYAIGDAQIRMLEKFFTDAEVPNSGLLVADGNHLDIEHWVAMLCQIDVDPIHLVWQKTFASALCRKNAVKYLLKNHDTLKAVWGANPQAGLFLACVLREMAVLQKMDRPKEFYTCVVDCLNGHFPATIPVFCKSSIKGMDGLPSKLKSKLLGLPEWHAVSAGASDPASTKTTTTTTTTTTSTTSTTSSAHAMPTSTSSGGKKPSTSSMTTTSSSVSLPRGHQSS